MTTTRLAGRITDWNDERGFGFVAPNGGGDRAFVHVNAFQRGSRRPVEGDLISYLPARDAKGRLQARDIRFAGQRIQTPAPPSRFPRAAVGLGVLGLLAAGAALKLLPLLLAAAYLVPSLVAYAMYWMDKGAAQNGLRRIPESSLHLAGLLGGWPGALVAQQQFRHKTVKRSFQTAFKATVVINVIAMGWFVASGNAAMLFQ
jgi:uncharacterized membrane protein YsdA (DUF1294 family)/cold shock CspA family protein